MQDVDILISGGIVLMMDEADTIIDDGAVAIRGNRIAAVGTREALSAVYRGATTLDAQGMLIMPGLINGHTHAAMTCFRGIADDLPLMTWLNDFILPAEAKNVRPELVYHGTVLACAEMILSGTTTFCDMYIFEEDTARAAKEAGMRCLVGEVLYDFPSPSYKTPAEGLAYTERLLKTWADDPLVGIMVEPHSLYTCSPDLLRQAKNLADRYNAPMGTHLLENPEERAMLTERLGMPATAFLAQEGILNERFTAFHGVSMDSDDIARFADAGASVVHCAESNAKLACGIAPVTALLAAGVAVGMGADGCASGNKLDLFEEMDSAAKLAKLSALDPAALPARDVLRLATINGAKALGMGDITGSLEKGKRADVILVDLQKPHLTPMYHPYSHAVYAVVGEDVDSVIIDGRLVMHRRKLLTLDEKEAMARVNDLAAGIRRSIGMS